ncbi:MAG: hypothetical protein K2Y71_18675 [Xanthobacteraceae bacterium]|nr:hypothetical protein [Xanthobacteraceae bacterium]
MRLRPNSIVALGSFVLASFLTTGIVNAQTIQADVRNIVLKNGETTEFGDLWLISRDCKSLMMGTPEVEVMDGPPGVVVEVRPAKVVPRGLSCANPIAGGKLFMAAKAVEEYSNSTMVLRITYKTRNGDRQFGQHVKVTLFP